MRVEGETKLSFVHLSVYAGVRAREIRRSGNILALAHLDEWTSR